MLNLTDGTTDLNIEQPIVLTVVPPNEEVELSIENGKYYPNSSF